MIPTRFPNGIAGGSLGNQDEKWIIDEYGRMRLAGSFISATIATLGSTALTLPTTAGQNGQTLTSDGANGTTWATGSGSTGVTSITGTANQVIASAATGAVALSLPQSIDTAALVTFGKVTAATAVLTSLNVATLTATGSTALQGATQITSLNVATLTATGAAILQSTLTVSGVSALGTTTITSLNVNGGLTVTGAVALSTPLTVPFGGTGVQTITSGGVTYGNGAGVLLATAQGATNTVLTGTNGAPAFSATPTLTTLNLGVAASTAGTLKLSGATSGTVTMVSSVAAGTWTMTLPTSGGSSGQFLQTNGSGLTTWAAASGSSSGFPIPGGRLTTESGVPVSTSNRTAQGTLYYTPYLNNQVWTYDSSVWTYHTFSEQSLALTVTSGKNYDVFEVAGTSIELSAAWTNDTTRADALAQQDGVWVKSSDHSRLWIGTIRASGSNQTADSGGDTTTQVGGQRYVWNYYNQVPRFARVFDSTSTWSYTTQTIRQANGAAGNKCEYVTGLISTLVTASLVANIDVDSNATFAASSGIGVDATNAFSGNTGSAFNTDPVSGIFVSLPANYSGYPGLGYHFISWNEYGADGGSIFRGAFNATHSGLTVNLTN